MEVDQRREEESLLEAVHETAPEDVEDGILMEVESLEDD